MALVDGDEAHAHAAQLGEEDVGGEALGRYVEKLVAAQDAVVERYDDAVAAHARVDGCGLDTSLAQARHLILHEGDEGGDHDAHSLLCQGGYLEGDALAAARRHESERVASAAYAADDVLLYAAKRVVAEVLAQNAPVVHVLLLLYAGLDALDEKLHLATLMGILLYGVADVERLLRLDVSGLRTLAEGDTVHDAV